jgi:DNA topoisomerase-2
MQVDFEVKLSRRAMAEAVASGGGLAKLLKLERSLSTGNMHLFAPEGGVIERYERPTDIVEAWFPLRLEYYRRRRTQRLGAVQAEMERLAHKSRFIGAVVSGELSLAERPRAELLAALRAEGYPPLRPPSEEGGGAGGGGYDYLLRMPLWSLTTERVEQLLREAERKAEEHRRLAATTAEEIWRSDLAELDDAVLQQQQPAAAGREGGLEPPPRRGRRTRGKARGKAEDEG